MNLENNLKSRAQNQCELCGNPESLQVFEVSHAPNAGADAAILVCGTCASQLEAPDTMDPNHWRCLNDSMWSPVPAVQVIAWRTLNHLKGEGWPQDLLDMMYLEEETLAWAKAAVQGTGNAVVHRDVNGNILQAGDNVVLIKDLKVKPDSIVLYGESLGCAVSTALMQSRPVQAVILQSPFINLARTAKDKIAWAKIYPDFMFEQNHLDNLTPYKTKHPPLLLIHGDKDWILNPDYSKEIYKAAIQPKQLLLLEGKGHNDIYPEHAMKVVATINQFLTSKKSD